MNYVILNSIEPKTKGIGKKVMIVKIVHQIKYLNQVRFRLFV